MKNRIRIPMLIFGLCFMVGCFDFKSSSPIKIFYSMNKKSASISHPSELEAFFTKERNQKNCQFVQYSLAYFKRMAKVNWKVIDEKIGFHVAYLRLESTEGRYTLNMELRRVNKKWLIDSEWTPDNSINQSLRNDLALLGEVHHVNNGYVVDRKESPKEMWLRFVEAVQKGENIDTLRRFLTSERRQQFELSQENFLKYREYFIDNKIVNVDEKIGFHVAYLVSHFPSDFHLHTEFRRIKGNWRIDNEYVTGIKNSKELAHQMGLNFQP